MSEEYHVKRMRAEEYESAIQCMLDSKTLLLVMYQGEMRPLVGGVVMVPE